MMTGMRFDVGRRPDADAVHQRLLVRRSYGMKKWAALLCMGTVTSALAQTPPPPLAAVLFENVRVFDGRSDRLLPAQNVLVVGNRIQAISVAPITPPAGSPLTRIAGGGRTLMPGLIDAHTHIALSTIPLAVGLSADPNYVQMRAVKAADEMLMRGFTAIREVAGNTFGLKRAIDEGHLRGPRIWPSGASISQTSGHGDYRSPWHDLPRADGTVHWTERTGHASLADGPDEVTRRVREQLMRGASHIKLMAGGGVASDFDPLDVTQYSEAEFAAAVRAAENWGTYVTVHAYTPDAIQVAIRAGVRSLEHGNLIDDATARLVAERGVWWCIQPFLDDEDAIQFARGSVNWLKQQTMTAGTDRAYELAKKHKVKTAFGTDTLFDAKLATRQGAQLAKLARWYPPAEVLKIATGNNGELLQLSGLRSPYPGKIGVVEPEALADLLLVDGDPIANLDLIKDPEKNFVVIMKDGKVYKQTLP
jgi:imidazolonepropionase-like amidohydrolase